MEHQALQILALVASGVRNLRPPQLEPRERFNVFSSDVLAVGDALREAQPAKELGFSRCELHGFCRPARALRDGALPGRSKTLASIIVRSCAATV